MKPLVSVVMPMRNAERFVKESLRSLLDQNGQDKTFDLEVVVVDDGSTDRSAEIVRELNDPRIQLIPGPQRGISAAFNAGLAAAKGQILARCDADDLYPPDRLGWQVRWLDEHPEFGAVCGYYAHINDASEFVADHHNDEPVDELTDELRNGRGRSHMCAYAFRTEILRSIGGCREWFVTSEDADLQYRLAEVTRIGFEPRRAYLYRLHGDSITHQQASAKRLFFEESALRFQQQRRGSGSDDLQRGNPPAIADFSPGATARHPDEQIQGILLGSSWKEHAQGNKSAAVRLGFRALRMRPTNFSVWKSVVALILKPSGKSR
jgi:glycosyltransferase involved in cell wall biosynthesis